MVQRHLKWGILGTGAIAKRFAEGLPLCKHGELVAVGSRAQETAEKFTKEFLGKPYDSYQAVLDDPEVEAVYISLPHHLHCEWTIKAAQAGKHILCEKPFTLNLREAKEAMDAVKAADVFFMEAFMYRCHPQTLNLHKMLKDGVIGTPRMIHAEFGFVSNRPGKHFRIDPELGGGALMDVGCYCVSFMRFVTGENPVKAVYNAELEPDGYDRFGCGLLEFPSGVRGTFGCSVHCQMNNTATVFGDNGKIILTSPWFCNGEILVHLHSAKEPERVKVEQVPHLWGNQSVVVAQLLDRREAPFISRNDTLGNMRTLDGLRRSAGLKFPADEAG